MDENIEVKNTIRVNEINKKQEEKRIPRPPNAFMIFGQQYRRTIAKKFPQCTNKQISKILGNEWRNMSAEKKHYFHRLADEAYTNHMKKYPGYYYSPLEARQRKAERKRKFLQKNGRKTLNDGENNDDETNNENKNHLNYHRANEAGEQIPQQITHRVQYGQLYPFYFQNYSQPNNLQFILNSNQTVKRTHTNEIILPKTAATRSSTSSSTTTVNIDNGNCDECLPKPSIYHVSHKDPSLALSEDSTSLKETDVNANDSSVTNTYQQNDFTEFMSNYLPPMDNPAILITAVSSMPNRTPLCNENNDDLNKILSVKVSNANTRVIVKREPTEDENASLMLTSILQAMSNE